MRLRWRPTANNRSDSCAYIHSYGITHVSLGQQTRTELHVIFKVKGSTGLELGSESCEGSSLVEFLHAADTAELALSLLGHRKTGSSAISATMVVVRHGGGVRCWVGVVMVVCRHDVSRGCACVPELVRD